MQASGTDAWPSRSHPSRVRGLKYRGIVAVDEDDGVAPFTGAWIEILNVSLKLLAILGRTLHGCVD